MKLDHSHPFPVTKITIEYSETIKQNHNNEDSFNNSQVVNEQLKPPTVTI